MAEAERFVVFQTGTPIALQDATGSYATLNTYGLVTLSQLQQAGEKPVFPKGRLTLTTGIPYLTSSVANTGTIYYTQSLYGNTIPYYTTLWNTYFMTAEMSLALDSNAAHTGYHQSGKLFDIFFDYNGGTGRIGTGPAWASDTVRADNITAQNGVYVNSAAIIFRYGTGASDFTSIAAKQLTYLGTFVATANGQTRMDINTAGALLGNNAVLGLWNAYNRAEQTSFNQDTTASWIANNVYQPLNNSTSNRITFVRGLDDDTALIFLEDVIQAPAAPAGASGYIVIAMDSVVAGSTFSWFSGHAIANAVLTAISGYMARPGLGLHYAQAMQLVTAAANYTYFGGASQAFEFRMPM